MKPSILVVDNTDDRREIWHTLHRLRPGHRARFLQWACSRVSNAKGDRPMARVTVAEVDDAMRHDDGDNRLTNSVYALLLTLGNQWNLDLMEAAKELEQWAKGRQREPVEKTRLGATSPRT